jgi:formyl-CoA transferase
MEDTLRPAIEAWAASRDKIAVCEELGRAGIAAGPCFSDEELVHDEHVRIRNMLVEMPRTDGEAQPVLVPGNPVKISTVADGPDTRVPWLGEHTDEVLGDELGLDKAAIADLRERGIVS